MALVVRTLNDAGNPVCPMCETEMLREGQFCSEEHWDHFHSVIYDMGIPIEMEYLDMYEQPFYNGGHDD